MCNIEVALDIELDLYYQNARIGESILSSSKQISNVKENAVLINFHNLCNFWIFET